MWEMECIHLKACYQMGVYVQEPLGEASKPHAF